MKKVAEIIKTEKSEGIKIMKKSYLFAGAAALLAVVAGCHFTDRKGKEPECRRLMLPLPRQKKRL